MSENRTELVFILDRSGSMRGLEGDTIGGFNAMLEQQKKEAGEVTVTTVLFDDRYELLHDRIDLRGVAPITDREYYVRGCTALLDALGRTMEKIDRAQQHTAPACRADRVLFVITTDGMENASRQYTADRIRRMVEGHQERGWEFLFLGANMDAIATARTYGIRPEHAVRYHADHRGTRKNFEAVSGAVSYLRTFDAPLSADWKADIEADFSGRRAGEEDGSGR